MTNTITNLPAEAVQTKFNTSYRMSLDEMMEISFHLQKYHGLFNKFFNAGVPIFDYAQPTAAVYANTDGKFIGLKINPDFWERQSIHQRLFVIAHECLHLILDHLSRLNGRNNPKIWNYAVDLVVNHSCVEKFGFRRSEIDPGDSYCWVDKFFKPVENVSTTETAEYYYELLHQKHERGELPLDCDLVDEHSSISPDDINDFIDGMNKNLTPEEKDQLKGMIESQAKGAGTGGGAGRWTFFNIVKKKKKKWESVIKQWALHAVGRKEKIHDQWAKRDRRNALLGKELFMPSELVSDLPKHEKNKIEVFFFMDTSGSCHSYAERMLTAALSLPEKHFAVRLFFFHDYVVETDINDFKVHLGGGTNFGIMEKKIQDIIREGGKYPKACFVVTDGAGTTIKPEFPERWHWFLTEQNKMFIPKESKVYKLEDYE